MQGIKFIDEVEIKNKKVLLRVDFNVSLNPDFTIADDFRIRQSISTINHLLNNYNKLIIVTHLGRPKTYDVNLSLEPVVKDLQKYLPDYKVTLVNNFLANDSLLLFENQTTKEILVLENIRFYPQEEQNDVDFSKKLAKLADVFVNDAFAVANRNHASVVGITKHLPSYGGLLLKKEITIISSAVENPKKPFLAIVGGAKIKSKIGLINRLTEIADDLIVGGGLANTFLKAQGFEVGKSLHDSKNLNAVRRLFFLASEKNTTIQLPVDVVAGNPTDRHKIQIVSVDAIPKNLSILDVGPQSLAKFGAIINKAKTIIWNGPVGYIENPAFRRGTDFIYYAIAQNTTATSIVGGGDTLAAISKKEYLDKITHISTGGGAMLEFIEKGTLPGIEALKK